MTQLKKITGIGLIILILLVVHTKLTLIAKQDPDSLGMGDRVYQRKQFSMDGQWVPGLDPLKIGENNFATLQNIRYTATGVEGVLGYSKINTTDLVTYLNGSSGIHFVNPYDETHVLVQAENAGYTSSVVWENTTAIPDQGDFSGTSLHVDDSSAGLGRFSFAPGGQIGYANGEESMIFAGTESRVAAVFKSTATIENALTNGRDYTTEAQNTLSTTGNVFILGGGNDSYTKLLLHMDGDDNGTTFTDSASGSTTHTVTPTSAITDQDVPYFGTASGYFSGSTSYLSVPDHVDWYMGTSAFTIDFWVRASGTQQPAILFGQYEDSDNSVNLQVTNNSMVFRVEDGGVQKVVVSGSGQWSYPNRWHHIAVIRGWGGVTTSWAMTVDGKEYGTLTSESDEWPDFSGASASFMIGGGFDIVGTPYYHNGWIDELRITKGLARWTDDFSVAGSAYDTPSRDFVVGSTRPLEGVKFYVSNACTATDATLTAKEWDGSSWATLTTTDGTSGLGNTGSVTWTMTSKAQPKYLEGLYLYWYYFTLSDGTAIISHISVDKGFQDIVDVWNGVYREPISFQAYHNGIYQDYTLEVNEASNVAYPVVATIGGLLSSTSGDYLLAMFDDRTAAINFQMLGGSGNTLSGTTATVSYWDGSAWEETTGLVDLTKSGTTSLAETGVMSWKPPSAAEEFPRTLFGISGYAYKIAFDAALGSDGDDEDNSEIGIDLVYGIPAQKRINGYKFPLLYKERLFLCNSVHTKEGNRCDYSETNAPDVWNGAETSDFGKSLYFGNSEELVAGAQIYNRFGSAIYNTALLFKESQTFTLDGDGPDNFAIKTVSQNIGCPAPLTLATAEIGYQMDKESTRNVVLWLSHQGPMLFDGAVIAALKGVENFFDQTESECINFDYIDKATGWFDSRYKEYNVLFPSGAGQTTNNKWIVYDLVRQKWYEKVPDVYPYVGFPVHDTAGTEYIYAMRPSGQMVRLENGLTWAGSAVTNTLKTAEIIPTGNVWDRTSIRYVKLVGLRTAEDIDVTVKHYYDGYSTANTLTAAAMDQGSTSYRFFKNTQAVSGTTVDPWVNWSHQFEFTASMSATTKGLSILGWGFEYNIDREDLPMLTAGVALTPLYFTSDQLYYTTDWLTFD